MCNVTGEMKTWKAFMYAVTSRLGDKKWQRWTTECSVSATVAASSVHFTTVGIITGRVVVVIVTMSRYSGNNRRWIAIDRILFPFERTQVGQIILI